MVCSPFILHHSEDPDGIISAALLSAYCERTLHEIPAEHFPLRYDTIKDQLPNIVAQAERSRPCKIFLADLNMNPAYVQAEGDLLLSRLVQAPYPAHREELSIVWFDHHQETEQQKEDYAQRGITVIHNASQCASLLVAKHYGLEADTYYYLLASIAQAHDYTQAGQTSIPLQIGNRLEGIIAMANAESDFDTLQRLRRDLKDGQCIKEDVTLLPPWEEQAMEYSRRKTEALRLLEESITFEAVGSYKLLFALAPPILSQKPAPRYLRGRYSADADVIVCLFAAPYKNHIILGKKDSTLDVVAFCRSQGGGGRNNAGGFTFSEAITPENYAAQREIIMAMLGNYLQK